MAPEGAAEAGAADKARMLNPVNTTNPREQQDVTADAVAPELRNFSIVREGPLYRLARVTVLDSDRGRLARLGVIIGLIGWAPLVVLTALQAVLFVGPTVTFSASLGTHARFLLRSRYFSSQRRGSTREPARFSVSLSGPGLCRSRTFQVLVFEHVTACDRARRFLVG